jgi:hypothetical protein
MSVTKSWIDRMKKADDDLQEVLEETDIAEQIGHRRKQGRGSIDPHLRDPSRLQQIISAKARTAGFEAKSGKALEYDIGQRAPIADDIGEDSDEERLLDEARDNVVILAPAPEQRSERDIDNDQRRRDEGNLARKQAEPAVDILRENR